MSQVATEKVPQFITPRVEAVPSVALCRIKHKVTASWANARPPAERHELFETQLHIVARFLHIFKEVPGSRMALQGLKQQFKVYNQTYKFANLASCFQTVRGIAGNGKPKLLPQSQPSALHGNEVLLLGTQRF